MTRMSESLSESSKVHVKKVTATITDIARTTMFNIPVNTTIHVTTLII
jgi:hypothetical protein